MVLINGCLGLPVTAHRLASHRSWNCPRWIEKILIICNTLTLSGSAMAFAMIHRKHHRFTDTEKDPHSPHYKGRFYALWLGSLSIAEPKYAVDLVRDKLYFWQHTYYFLIVLVFVGLLYLISPFAIVYVLLVPAAFSWVAAGSINLFCHPKSGIKNSTLLAFLVWGEGYHKNHHDAPNKSRFGKYDLSGIVINLLKKK